MMLESTPPESRTPTGTVASRLRCTARTSVSRIASKTQDGGSSAGARLFSSNGALPGKAGPAISPSPGVQAYPGGNGSTSGRQSSSKAFSSEANSVVSSRRAQYSGAMPSTSRAAERAVRPGDHERERAPQVLEAGHTVVLVELQGGLQVRSGGEP